LRRSSGHGKRSRTWPWTRTRRGADHAGNATHSSSDRAGCGAGAVGATGAEAVITEDEETHVLTFTDRPGATVTCRLHVGSFLESGGDPYFAHSTTAFASSSSGTPIDLRCLENDLRIRVDWTDNAGGRHTSSAHAINTREVHIGFDAVEFRPYVAVHDVTFFNCQADCTFEAVTGTKEPASWLEPTAGPSVCFPEPVVVLKRAMVWSWRDVERWARATGACRAGDCEPISNAPVTTRGLLPVPVGHGGVDRRPA
jgi:hypothetical protein